MFKTLPDGVEIYFAWPSRTARIVPNKAVRKGIELRDTALRAWVAFAGLTTILEKSNLQNSPIALVILIIGVVGIVDRWRYLSKLKALSLELVQTKKREAHPEKGEGNPEIPKSVQITSEEIDRAYLRDYDRFYGAIAIAWCVLGTLCSLYILFTEVPSWTAPLGGLPMIFSLLLMASSLAFGYVGFRILAGKRSKRRGRHLRHKDAI
jgi:hypothetical protein